ncbi:hypothetical protein GDO78_009268, partial [Eleutherodactylus coqui]
LSRVSEDPLCSSTNSHYGPPDTSRSDEEDALLGEHQINSYCAHKPVDHYNGAYIIFFILGVGSTLPWNFICTAKHYWIYKLRNCSEFPIIEEPDVSDTSDYFESYISIASAVPAVPCLILNFYLVNRISSQARVLWSLAIMLLIFIFITILVKVDTSFWTTEFFALTLICVAILSGASNILMASVFGVTGRFPMKHSQSLISGQAMGGTVSALAAILDLSIASNVTDSALAYFLTADIFLLLCIGVYLILPRMEYASYYLNLIEARPDSSDDEGSEEKVDTSSSKTNSPPILPILKQVKVLAACFFYTFFISIIIFPTIAASIESVDS